MAVTPVLGVYAKLGIGDTIPTTVAMDFHDESLTTNEQFVDTSGLRGTRSRMANRNVLAARNPAGSLTLTPTAVEFAAILKYALGGTPSGTSYPLAELLPTMAVQIVKGLSMFGYAACKVARAQFRASRGNPLELRLDLLALAETVGLASSFPSLTLDTTTNPFMFEQLTLTVGGTVCQCFEFELTLDNGLASRQVNSVDPTAVYALDRSVQWRHPQPFGDTESLYQPTATGIAVSAVFTNGATSLSLSSPKVIYPKPATNVTGRDEIRMQMVGTAGYSAAAGDELVCTLDSSP